MNYIPMLDLKVEYEYMKQDIDNAIKKCLDHQKWIFGPEVKELELKISEYIGVKHCIGVSSGTDALVLSLRAIAIKLKGKSYFDKSDGIITTPFTFTATGDAILRAGATPVFIDINPVTYNIDTEKINKYLNHLKLKDTPVKPVGIIPVHLYGQACNMDDIEEIARNYNLFVVEDVAQAFGGEWRGRKLGSFGIAGCFSFFPSKNLGGFGDGGMVSTNDDDLNELVRILLRHGGRDKYNVDYLGYNARLDTLQASIVLAKFKYINELNTKRKDIAKQYSEGLKELNLIDLPQTDKNANHVYHQYTIRIKKEKRDRLKEFLASKGISSMVYYPVPLHKMRLFDNGNSIAYDKLENSETVVKEVLSLPIEPLQGVEITAKVINEIKKFFNIS